MDESLTSGPVPLYYQLQRKLREDIHNDVFKPGSPLPSEAQLCERFGVSRITVGKALTGLLHEGLIERRRGVGTFVAQRPSVTKTVDLSGSLDEMLKRAAGATRQLLSPPTFATPPVFVKEGLKLNLKSQVIVIEHLFTSSDGPYAYSKIFAIPELAKLIDLAQESNSNTSTIYMIEESAGTKVIRAEQFIEPVNVNSKISKHLGLKRGAPVLYTQRTYFVESNRPVMIVQGWYNPQRYRYNITLYPESSRD